MVFRDEGAANRSRLEVLEAEVARLEAENSALRAAAKSPLSARAAPAAIAMAVGAVLAGGAAYYAGFVVAGRSGEEVGTVLSVFALVMLVCAASLALLPVFTVVVPPNRIAVVIGRPNLGPEGSRGFRVVSGARVALLPFIETVSWLPDGPFPLDLVLSRVSIRDGSVTLQLRARVSFSRGETALSGAVERFVGTDAGAVTEVARELLEGTARNVTSTLRFEELEQEREKVAQYLTECDVELARVGLKLDAVHLLHVERERSEAGSR